MHTQSQPSGLQLQDVNAAILDALALEYLAKEDLVEEANPSLDTQLRHKLAALAAYQQLQQGHVSHAMTIISHCCPSALEDLRLKFKLKRQQFVELLRQATARGDAAALACARDELAPLALDAYPEAYLDFKKALLMLLQTQQSGAQQQQQQTGGTGQVQQQQPEWSLHAREQLAEMVFHTMAQQLDCRPPLLSLLLAYLLHLFSQYSSGAGGSSRGGSSSSQQVQQLLAAPGGQLAQGLLLQGRDEGPLPPDMSGQGYPERDVQALMAAVSIPRSAALNALKACGGDAASALAHELARLRLNTGQVDLLVWEYASARGLLEPADGPAAVAAAVAAAAATAHALEDMDIDGSEGGAAPSAAAAAAAPGARSNITSAAAAAGGGAMGGPAGKIHGSTGGGSSSSPFHQGLGHPGASTQQGLPQQQGSSSNTVTAVDRPPGVAPLARPPPVAPFLLTRSASQSPPYKVPRWRCKQNPSRFHLGSGDAHASATAAASDGPAQHQQPPQPQQGARGELQQVVVVPDNEEVTATAAAAAAAAAGSSSSLNGAATAAGGVTNAVGGKRALGSQLGNKQRGYGSSSKVPSEATGSLDSSAAAAAAAAAASNGLVEQLVQHTRAAQQQQRWQQLQQQLKGQAAASGQLVKQLEAQEQLQQLHGLLKQQAFAEAEQLIEQQHPGLLQQQPRVLFDLKRCQFTALIESNQLAAALQLARSQLTPLADAHSELLPALKASMALLLPGGPPAAAAATAPKDSGSSVDSSKVWEALLPLLQARLGLEQPRLVQLLQVLLTAHKAWFKLQRCSDPFAAALQLNKLQQASASPAEPAAAAAGAVGGASGRPDTAAAAAGQEAAGQAVRLAAGAAAGLQGVGGAAGGGGVEWGYGPSEGEEDVGGAEDMDDDDEGDLGFGEGAVLQVMEVLELPRTTALELLAEHGGDPQAVIMAIIG